MSAKLGLDRRWGGALVLFAGLLVLPLGRTASAADQPAIDCLAANAASLKLDNLHRLRAERTELLACAVASCPADIRRECIRRVDDVTAAIPSIMFDVRDREGNDLSAVKVTMDDAELLTDRLEGIALPVDPGAHQFTFEAAGHAPGRKRLVIREGEKRRLEVVILGDLADASGIAPGGRAFDRTPPALPAAGMRSSGESSGRPESQLAEQPPGQPLVQPAHSTKAASSGSSRVVPLIAAGIGVLGLAAGTFFGVEAISKRNDARTTCPDVCSDQASVDKWQDARRAGTISTVAFAAGGAGIAGALIFWLTSRPESEGAASSHVAFGPGAIAVRGRW